LPIFDLKNVTTLYHPPYSPDLSLPDYLLFPKLKIKLKGLHFADAAEIQEAVTDELKRVQKEEFLTAFQKLYDCIKACIYATGAYFELKKGVSSSRVFDFQKKSVSNFWTAPCILSKMFYTLEYVEAVIMSG
jgi:6-phosphogluconate dehydrogenase